MSAPKPAPQVPAPDLAEQLKAALIENANLIATTAEREAISNAIIAELSKRLAPASEYMAKVQAQQSRERVRGLEAKE